MNYLQTQNKRSKKSFQIIIPLVLMLFFGVTLTSSGFALPKNPSAFSGELMMTLGENPSNIFGGKKKGKSSKKDPYACKAKKPNIYSSNPPKTSSRSKLYSHSVSKKRVKKSNNSVFSTTTRRYNVVDKKSSKGSKRENSGRKRDRIKK